jgi:hypothetical protein
MDQRLVPMLIAVVVLAPRHRYLQACAADHIRFVVHELLQRECGRPVQVDREPDLGIRDPVHDALQRFAFVVRRSG